MRLRKFVAIILLAVAALSLTACKKDSTAGDASAPTTPDVPAKTVTIRVLSGIYYDPGTDGVEPGYLYQCEYDTAGNVIAKKESARAVTYAFDVSGNPLTREYYRDGEWICSELYTYTNAGEILSYCYKDPNRTSLYEYIYDQAGHLTTEQYNTDAGISVRVRYTYDSNGNLEKVQNIATNGKNTDYTLYFYDESNRLTSQKTFNAIDQQTEQTIYTYNNDGLLTSIVSGSEYYEDSRVEYTYDQNGNLLEETSYTYGVLDIRKEYDENGNLLREETMDYFCNYTYNAENQLLTRESYKNDILTETVTCTYDEGGITGRYYQRGGNTILTFEYTELTVSAYQASLMQIQQEKLLNYLEQYDSILYIYRY